jgi:hypothetical protein
MQTRSCAPLLHDRAGRPARPPARASSEGRTVNAAVASDAPRDGRHPNLISCSQPAASDRPTDSAAGERGHWTESTDNDGRAPSASHHVRPLSLRPSPTSTDLQTADCTQAGNLTARDLDSCFVRSGERRRVLKRAQTHGHGEKSFYKCNSSRVIPVNPLMRPQQAFEPSDGSSLLAGLSWPHSLTDDRTPHAGRSPLSVFAGRLVAIPSSVERPDSDVAR